MGSGWAVQRACDKDRTEQNLKDIDSGHSEALAFPAIGAPLEASSNYNFI